MNKFNITYNSSICYLIYTLTIAPFMATGKNRYKEININKKKDKTSVLSIDASGCFSSIGVAGEEIETLLSSRSFSYDSSCEFSHSMDRIAGKSDYRTFNRPTGNKVGKLNKIKKN